MISEKLWWYNKYHVLEIQPRDVANGQGFADRQFCYAALVVYRAKARASLVCRLKRKEWCRSRLPKPEKSGDAIISASVILPFPMPYVSSRVL